jgi:hypothetical protein
MSTSTRILLQLGDSTCDEGARRKSNLWIFTGRSVSRERWRSVVTWHPSVCGHQANLASTPAGSADAAKETFAFHGKPMSGAHPSPDLPTCSS